MKKLFVGNLPYTANDGELNGLFSAIGKVISAVVLTDRYSGRSRGFGFVEMENDEEAEKAIKELNGKDMGGRKIIVSVAKPREERPDRDNFAPRGDRRGGFGGDRRGGFDRNRR